MLNRRHIRVKVMQSLYMMKQSNSENIHTGEKFLENSLENFRDLYLLMISTLIEIRNKEEEYISLSQKKHLATQEERNPNNRFIDNQVLNLLSNSISITTKIEERKINDWYIHDQYISSLLEDIKASDIFAKYMSKPTITFEDDKKFVLDVFTKIIAPNDKIYDYFEDKKLTWVDDYPVVNTQIQKQLRQLKEKDVQFLVPKLFKDKEDEVFAKDLYQRTILNFNELTKEFQDKTPNWDPERIAELDTIILRMAICEMLRFPSIPVKVTINEYLELAKEYSTAKSSIFINGVLDNLSKLLTEEGRIKKTGKGLL